MSGTVAVVGGGYGGISAAKALDGHAEVVLIDPREHFAHNTAALRGVVDPQWSERIFFPFGKLLRHGRFLPGRVVRADASGVTLADGQRVDADHLVLATGVTYPFPAKIDGTAAVDAQHRFRTVHAGLSEAPRVLLLGAGAVGLELAGEIAAVWPEKEITIVDPADDVLSGAFPAEFRAELRRQLDALGVRLLLGTRLSDEPPVPAAEPGTFGARTLAGDEIVADIWFRCFGGAPFTGYLDGSLAAARDERGRLRVTDHLRVDGFDNVFAVGDLAATGEPDTAKAAMVHGELVAANILASRDGAEMGVHQPGAAGIVIPLGPKAGASYVDGMGILDAEQTSQIKGNDLMVERFAGFFT